MDLVMTNVTNVKVRSKEFRTGCFKGSSYKMAKLAGCAVKFKNEFKVFLGFLKSTMLIFNVSWI